MSGIYIHIPFCKQACHYCNFHFSASLGQKEKMTDAMVKEIGLTPLFSGSTETCETLYFGGGTPSLLSATELQSLLDAAHKKFKLADDAEITLEANPDDITKESLAMWRAAGINRLSVGIQSFHDKELEWMHRAHNAAEALQSLSLIREAGFDNSSVDLIYGSPLLSDADWRENVDRIIEMHVPHISCYALTVEPRTVLDKMIALEKKENVDPEKQARQFLLLMEWMKAAGYEHYEISNFAKPGMHSKHNSSYWEGKLYYGFGPSAHSFNGKARRWNVANNSLYIGSLQKDIIPYEEELLSPVQHLNEYIMTALRTAAGIDLDKLAKDFGADSATQIKADARKFITTGKLSVEGTFLRLSDEGKLFADGIAADLFR